MSVVQRPVEPQPFVKWAGGKRRLLPKILPRLCYPKIEGCYHEPFVGGGAVFFGLSRLCHLPKARLSDLNQDLMTTYRTVRDNVTCLIKALETHETWHSRDKERYYFEVRDTTPTGDIAVASRMIFLNKTCFNGLFRTNRQGSFNVSYGHYENPNICDSVNLRAVSASLKGVDVTHGGFEDVIDRASRGDVVYFDPPYPGQFS